MLYRSVLLEKGQTTDSVHCISMDKKESTDHPYTGGRNTLGIHIQGILTKIPQVLISKQLKHQSVTRKKKNLFTAHWN